MYPLNTSFFLTCSPTCAVVSIRTVESAVLDHRCKDTLSYFSVFHVPCGLCCCEMRRALGHWTRVRVFIFLLAMCSVLLMVLEGDVLWFSDSGELALPERRRSKLR